MSRKFFPIAQIIRPHGRKGEFRLRLCTDHPETLTGAKKIYLCSDSDDTVEALPRSVETVRKHQDVFLMKLEGVDDIPGAQSLRNRHICLPREDLIPLAEGEFFLHDLIGLEVRDHLDNSVGRTEWIMETGGTPVLVVRGAGEEEILVPFSPESVMDVDLKQRLLILKNIPGLLEINR
ncbi:ribosome maturation factor RimM [bacterium BMS3Abin14]|nr:ribosome maturation factor RimM [bacterium BMS3Abin14]